MPKIINHIVTTIVFISLFFFPAFSQNSDIQSIRTRAYNGDAQAMIELAQYYKTKGNHDLAQSWLAKAEQANPSSSSSMKEEFAVEDNLNRADNMRDKDPMQALNIYLKYYDVNNVHALVSIGYLYDIGLGVEKNVIEANKYYQQAMDINRDLAYNYMNVNAPAAFKILEDDAYSNSNNLRAIKKVAAKYYEDGHDNALMSTSSNPSLHIEKWCDYDLLDKAERLYKKAIELGDVEAKIGLNEINNWKDLAKRDAESRNSDNQLFNSTMQNFAGVWRCRNSRTQYKFDSKGNGWFRNGSGRAWESLGVTYKSYNCISVYDAHARHTLMISGGTMTQDNSYVYYKE